MQVLTIVNGGTVVSKGNPYMSGHVDLLHHIHIAQPVQKPTKPNKTIASSRIAKKFRTLTYLVLTV